MYNDKNGMFLVGHHHKQQYHRENGAFIVETLRKNHSISKISQHPYGNEAGKDIFKSLEKHFIENSIYMAGPVPEEEMLLAAKKIGVKFSESYKKFIRLYGAAIFEGFFIRPKKNYINGRR